MRQRREGVERRPHVEFVALRVEQVEIDRHAARVRRTATGIGDDFRVGIDGPERPLRFHRPQGVEDAQSQAERPGERDGGGELVGGFAMQPAFGISVDRPSR